MNTNSLPRAVPDIDRWFKTEISRWRSGAALVWTLLLTGPILYTTRSIAAISVFHPFNWIFESILHVISPWTWLHLVVTMMAVTLLTTQVARRLTVVCPVYITRWEKLVSVIRLGHIYSVGTTGILCGLITWCYMKLIDPEYQNLTAPCSQHSANRCLNEHHVFLLLHGLYVGAVYRTIAVVTGRHHMAFPIIQQSKFFQLKSSILSLATQAVWTALNRLKYFYLLYYIILGSVVKSFLSTHIGLHQRETETPINSLSGILDVSLLWHSTWSAAMIYFLLAVGTTIYKLYHTDWFQFPVETSSEKYRNLVLHQALKCESNRLVQYHGYQDLYLLSKHSLQRRVQLFTLTHLGGHPQNWEQIASESLRMLHMFVEQLSAYNTKIMANGSIKQLSAEKPAVNGNIRQRIMSDPLSPAGQLHQKPSFMQMFISDLKKNRVVAYFLAEDPDASSRKLFVHSQLYIWAVEALSYLVCASYEEDKYGVVQKTLPKIIDTLLTLQEQVEKHFRLVPNIGKLREKDDNDVTLRGALKVTLKMAIYRVITKFESHIKSVPLSSDQLRRLTHFIDYKE